MNLSPLNRLFIYACILLILSSILVYLSIICNIYGENKEIGSIIGKFKIIELTKIKQILLFPERKNKPLVIHLLTKFFKKKKHYIWAEFVQDLDRCPHLIDKCIFTVDQSTVEKADVVVIYANDQYKIIPPNLRPSYQKWVFSILESPLYTNTNLIALRYHFNLTMTFSMNSSVPHYYGICRQTGNVQKIDKNINYLEGKKYMAAWFVHNCKALSNRQGFVKGLAEHIEIHKYGCGGGYECDYERGEYCDRILLKRDYKFYLSLENSFCDDYLTEKTFRIMNSDIIPVISSRTDLSKRLPPHSYIDTRDFKSYEDLANYLHIVGSNANLYNEYFAWRQQGWECFKHEQEKQTTIGCRLCKHALENRQIIETADIFEHWNPKKHCVSGKQFYKHYI